MKTKLGTFLRQLRFDNNQLLKDMATTLNVTSAFLSAVENGKKSMPNSWYSILKETYSLDESAMDNLRQVAMESQKEITLEIKNASTTNRQLAVSFARQFGTMDDTTTRRIMDILNERKERNKQND